MIKPDQFKSLFQQEISKRIPVFFGIEDMLKIPAEIGSKHKRVINPSL